MEIRYCKYGILTPVVHGKVNKGERWSREEILLGEGILKILQSEKLYEKYAIQSLKRASMYSLEKVMMKWNRLIGNGEEKNEKINKFNLGIFCGNAVWDRSSVKHRKQKAHQSKSIIR